MAPNFAPHSLLTPKCRRQTILFCLCLGILFSFPLYADGSGQPETSAQPNISLIAPLDSSRDAISKQVTDFANWLDNFFGDERIYDESQNSHLKLNLLNIREEGGQSRYEANLQGKLTLPNTQKRLKLLLESDPGEEIQQTDTTVVQAVESQEQSLGLRYIQYSSDWLRAHTDVGVRFRSGLDTFVRFRLRGLFTLGQWNLRAAETLFWRESSGPGETTQLDLERRLAEDLLFRSTSKASWLDDTQQFDTGQNFFLIHNINTRRAVIYRAGLSAVSEPNTHTTGYILSVRLRQQIHRDWLFFEINPKVLYPEEEDFHPQRSLTLKLEVMFGGS